MKREFWKTLFYLLEENVSSGPKYFLAPFYGPSFKLDCLSI
jgi:hypothetical protein